MKAQRHVVQSATMARRSSGSKLMPEPSKLRQVRRAAAGFNQSPEPPLALSVPLSRFTSRVGGGSVFFVRHHSHHGIELPIQSTISSQS